MLGIQLAWGAMTVIGPLWTNFSSSGHQTPFKVGVRRALVEAFPLVMNDAMPARMELALEALVALDPVGVTDQPREALDKPKLTAGAGLASTPSAV